MRVQSYACERIMRHDNLGLIWLTSLKAPDHKFSLWRFMNSKKNGVSELFKQLVRVVAKCKLIGMVVNVVSGTKIRSALYSEGFVSPEGLEKTLEGLGRSIADSMTEIERQEHQAFGEYKPSLSMRRTLRSNDRIQKAFRVLEERSGSEILGYFRISRAFGRLGLGLGIPSK